MKKKIFFLFLISFLYACAPLNEDDKPKRRSDDREGDVKVPDETLLEGLSWYELLKNCKPDVDVPNNIIDVGLDIFNLQDKYPPGLIRKCLEKKLSDTHNTICEARIKLERKREKARTENDKARVENSIIKLDTLQFKWNQQLYDLALKLDNELIKQENKQNSKHLVGRVFNFFREEETEALRDILDIESYSTCHSYNEDNFD